MMYHCEGLDILDVDTKIDCINKGLGYHWINQKYNFDNLGQVRLILPGHMCYLLRHATLPHSYVTLTERSVFFIT